MSIKIESCQSVSSLTCQGIRELNRTIQHCILTQRKIFPHIDRIFPALWADANHYIESLADHLPVPYLSWENLTTLVNSEDGLSSIIDDITMSLSDQGKILILNEIGTSNRVVFLRPLWLGDILCSLFYPDNLSELNCHSYKKEYQQYGHLHLDLVRLLWINLLHNKEYFYSVWNILMRFLLVAYPKLNEQQLKSFLNSDQNNDIKFDYAIVPYYLPSINSNEQEEEKQIFNQRMRNKISISYRSSMLPLGFVHRFSVLILFKLDIIYIKHWNNFILGEHKEKEVQ